MNENHTSLNAKRNVAQRGMELVNEWANQLGAHLQRSAEEVRSNGLQVGDFPASVELEIRLMDDSVLRFKNAFALVDEGAFCIAVFSEHCGYHVFPYHDAVVSVLSKTLIYQQS